MTITYGNGIIFGFTYANVNSVRGATEIHKLLLDEIAYAPTDILSVAAPCLRGTGKVSKIRFASSPRKGTYWDRWIKETKELDVVMNIKMSDNTTLSKEDLALQAKAITDKNQYRQEILGEILDDDIPFCVISQKDFPLFYKGQYGNRRLGVDCAGSGADNNVFVVSDDNGILEIVKENQADTYKMYAIANELISKWNIDIVNIDTTGGFGNGLYDMLKMNYDNKRINAVNFGQKPINDCYANARSEMYFIMAEKVREGFYVNDNDIRNELSYTSYSVNSKGKTILVPKEQIKEIIGHSPDSTDALCLSLYEPQANTISKEKSLSIALGFTGF